MFQQAIAAVRTRVEMRAGQVAAIALAGFAGLIALVFVLTGLFVWLARSESLVLASFVFAGGFVLVALGAYVASRVMAGRERQASVEQPGLASMLVRNPAAALTGLRVLNVVRRNKWASLGTALAAGVALVLIGLRGRDDES